MVTGGALSWGELLEEACKKLGVDYRNIIKDGMSYPERATEICNEISIKMKKSYRDAVNELKNAIADLTNWYPQRTKIETFSGYLNALCPSCIITTNYDLVVESLLLGKSFPLGPSDQLVYPRGVVPVFHLHGIRTNPAEIIITQEDYIALFRPNEYRQHKLPLIVKESTVLFLGYGLGDVNVLTALDWSRNVFNDGRNNYPHEVIQVLRKTKPVEHPYRDKNDILLFEVDEIEKFFSDFSKIRSEEIDKEEIEKKNRQELLEKLKVADQGTVEKFLDNYEFRKGIIKQLASFPNHLAAGFISFFERCINETYERARPRNAFEAYDQRLTIILDVLTGFDVDNIPPALFQIAAYSLEMVSYFVGRNKGQSFSAAATWERRKHQLSSNMVKDLFNYSKRYNYIDLSSLITPLNQSLLAKEK